MLRNRLCYFTCAIIRVLRRFVQIAGAEPKQREERGKRRIPTAETSDHRRSYEYSRSSGEKQETGKTENSQNVESL